MRSSKITLTTLRRRLFYAFATRRVIPFEHYYCYFTEKRFRQKVGTFSRTNNKYRQYLRKSKIVSGSPRGVRLTSGGTKQINNKSRILYGKLMFFFFFKSLRGDGRAAQIHERIREKKKKQSTAVKIERRNKGESGVLQYF